MTGFFIRHPLSAIVATLLLTIFGLLSAFSLPIAQYPEIAPPTVMVSTTYIGADAEVLNDTVAQVIENEVNGIEGIDFTRFGRNYKVVLQAQAQYRSDRENTKFLFVKNRDGGMVPLDTLLHSRSLTGSSQISRYNGVKCVNFEGQAGEGYSSGQAMDALEEVAKEIAPTGFQIAWTGESRQLRDAQGTVLKVMGFRCFSCSSASSLSMNRGRFPSPFY